MNALMPEITQTGIAETRSGRQAKAAGQCVLAESREMQPLTAQQRGLVVESMTARLDYIPHDMFEQADVERQLFGEV